MDPRALGGQAGCAGQGLQGLALPKASRHSRLQAEEVFEPRGAGLLAPVLLRNQLLLRPGHLHLVGHRQGLGPGGRRGMGRSVPVVDQLGLEDVQGSAQPEAHQSYPVDSS